MYKIVKRIERGKELLYRVDYTPHGVKVTRDNVPDIKSKMKLGDLLHSTMIIAHYATHDCQAIQIDCIEQEFYDETTSRVFYSGQLMRNVVRGKMTKKCSKYRTPIPNTLRVRIVEKDS